MGLESEVFARERKSGGAEVGPVASKEGIFCEARRARVAVKRAVACKVNGLSDLATPTR